MASRCPPALTAAFRALDGAHVRWCLLRGEADLADPRGDVDLLVGPGETARVTAALAGAGFARLPAAGHGPHRFFLAYDAGADRWLKLDVVGALAFGPDHDLRMRDGIACLRRRTWRGAVAVLDDADAFWCLLLHRLLDKGSIGAAADDLRRLAAAPGCATSPLAAELDRRIAAPGCEAARLIAAARAGDTAALEALGPRLGRAWRRREGARALRRRIAVAAARRAAPAARIRRGMTVALVGADAPVMADGLARAFPLPARVLAAQSAGRARVAALRARGRLVVIDGRDGVRPDLTVPVDAGSTERDVTAAVWAAYRRRWQTARRPGASRRATHSRSSAA